MVGKKYLKIGVACLAVTALVIGLSVGLTQKNKNNNNAASSNAAYDTYDIGAIDTAKEVCYGKSGKSGGGSGKSGKSGGFSMMSYEGKSGKSGNRALYVPGILEAYGDDTDASTGKRRKLRHQLLDFDDRQLQSPVFFETGTQWVPESPAPITPFPTESPPTSGSYPPITPFPTESPPTPPTTPAPNTPFPTEPPPTPTPPPSPVFTPFPTDAPPPGTKSGKRCYYDDVCYGYGSSGKSGKSGGGSGSAYGSSGKSGKGSSGCGESGKSGGGSGAGSGCPSAPTTCGYGYPPAVQTTEAPPITTVAPAECICEEQPWVWDGAMCVRSCDLTGPGSPSATECCEENTESSDCPINDCGLIPTPSPTEGGTTTRLPPRRLRLLHRVIEEASKFTLTCSVCTPPSNVLPRLVSIIRH